MPPEESYQSPKFMVAKNQPNPSGGTSLYVRRRGFMEIYNQELPLDSLWNLIQRAPFSTHIRDIRFRSHSERQEEMRPIWNSSSGGGEINLDVEFLGI